MLFEKQIVNMFRTQFLIRCDDKKIANYFSAADFPGLQQEDFSFPSSCGHTLQGCFYSYDHPIPGRIIVFDHGFGGGHRSYMKEIELLCRHGFLVFAYDHTGCMCSGGENIRGFSQSLRDLDDCFKALKATDKCKNLDFSVMGHSWGGFSTLNICALHPEISHIVVLSGFVSVKKLVEQFFSGILKVYHKTVMALDPNTDYIGYDAVDSLSGTNAKTLLIYSANDKMVSKNVHYETLKAGLAHKENVRLLLVENKGHNPNYTENAVAYLEEFSASASKMGKKKKLQTEEQKTAFRNSWDWHRMTAQDEAVWAEIFKTLDA